MSDTASSPAVEWRPRANPWLIALAVMLATFMVILDTSIAVVALPYIAGNLGATQDESTWVLTSYLVANAIILPASTWFSGFFARNARHWRRRHAAAVASHPARKFSAGQARRSHSGVWTRHCRRAHSWPHS